MIPLIKEIKNCQLCLPHLENGVNPILRLSTESKIIIIGQAPGSIVHKTGIPWDDKSGERLREWLRVSRKDFYTPNKFGLLPMGFCYPGKGKNGDLPPRPECAPKWHKPIIKELKEVKLTLLIGQYAQKYYLEKEAKNNLTHTVKNYNNYLPHFIPLPHPSPRNNIWLKKNPWFKEEVIPVLQQRVQIIINK
jgi:uracil-DNA glycosylase